jgi:hypothetical protein
LSHGSLTRTRILSAAGALVLAACGSNAVTPGGTGGSNPAGTGGGNAAGTGGTSSAGTGGGSAGGTSGNNPGGTGGASTGGTGGSNAGGTGGNNAGGTGGTNAGGRGGSAGATGGSNAGGTGGNGAGGRGGNSAGGTGGASAGGTGGNSAGGRGGTAAGTGGSSAGGTGGSSAAGTGGSNPAGTGGGTASCGVGPTTGAPGFGAPTQVGAGTSTAKYLGATVTRDGVGYKFITNWWGQGWTAANVSYSGTGFTVASATGTSTPDGTPIGYPTTYCGRYSEATAGGNCGLPAAFSTIDTLWTGWKWSSADSGQYNAAWDIWLGTASAFQSYLMVWLRDPPGRQPAGNTNIPNVTVAGVPGTWIIRYGTVNSRPIVNYVRAEGQDACELEFNVMDFVKDAQARSATTSGLMLPGDTVRAIAVGFEFWTGPFANVVSEDFYVKLTTK